MAQKLTIALNRQKGLAQQLIQCAEEKRKALMDGELDTLKQVLEKEEEICLVFQKMEMARQAVTLQLLQKHGITQQGISLREIVEILPANPVAAGLNEAGNTLAEVVGELQRKNATVDEILTLKSDYADLMLEILAGSHDSNSNNRSYDNRGEVVQEKGETRGMYEVLI